MIDALGHHTIYTYDDYDRLTKTTFDDNTFTSIGYDSDGRKISETDQEGKVTTFAYDSVGNLVKVTDVLFHETKYTYDNRNNRISQTDANNHTTTMAYDKQNRLVRRTYPGSGQDRFGYDKNGNMVYKVSGADSTVYEYDTRNREIKRTFASGHSVITKYTKDGKRDTVIDYRGKTVNHYDSLTGLLVRVENPDSTWLEYEYDINRNKTITRTPWSETHYRYDSLNRMCMVTSGTDTTRYFYDQVGNRDSVINPNGTRIGYTYDNLNRLKKVANYGRGNAVQTSYEYSLNRAGMRTGVTEADGSAVNYEYDDLYRLTSETRAVGSAGSPSGYAITYTYDNVGNRLQQTKDGVVTTYTYNDRDQLITEGSVEYTYDAAGRMKIRTDSSGITTYSWIDDNCLENVTQTSGIINYEYDTDNNRISTISGGIVKKYLVDKTLPYGLVIAEYDNNSSLKCGYVYGLDRISQSRDSVVRYYVADGQGSIRNLTDTAGNVTDVYYYSAFGEEVAKSGTTENEFRYVGEQWDPNAGFYYLRARWMDPGTGRFVSVDPYSGDPQAPVSLHRYLYANGSPVSFKDPTGKFGIMDVAFTIGIISTLVGITVPTYNSLFTKYVGTTDHFSLTFGWGAHGGPTFCGPYGGALTARIQSLPSKNTNSYRPEHTDYAVILLGLGFGVNVDLIGGTSEFTTIGKRTTGSFAGIGNMTSWIEIGVGPISWTFMSFIQLADGTLVDDCFSLAQGIDEIPDFSGYISMALWIPISK